MSKFGGNRNFGFGRQIAYAGHRALETIYQGHFATVAAHSNRWRQVSQWCREQGIRDAREISLGVLHVYAEDLADQVEQGEMAVAYAQNLLSTCNVVLSALRGDRSVRIAPAAVVGRRTAIRTTPPAGLAWDLVLAAAGALLERGHHRAATVVMLARYFGLRMREASRLDLQGAHAQALQSGCIAITEGTKGGRGRERERLIPVSDTAASWLAPVRHQQGAARNIIPAGMAWITFCRHLHAVVGPVFHQHSLVGLHDLRAGYACDRYAYLTGHPAPCVVGRRQADKDTDQAARVVIADELGHGRIDVVGAYVGSSR
jgi:hypothetical protein